MSLNPGNISTDLQRNMPWWQLAIVVRLSVSFLYVMGG